MALIKELKKTHKDKPVVHEVVDCTYSIFEMGGKKYLQLDTYGKSTREIPGKVSQSLQIDRDAALELRKLLDELLNSQ